VEDDFQRKDNSRAGGEKKHDHVPITVWCFGFEPPEELKWEKNGKSVNYWNITRVERTSD
jgi:hypothetical protein